MPSLYGTGFIRVARGTATTVVACAAVLLLPVLSGASPDGVPAWQAAARVAPQALALALPMGFVMATVFYAAGTRMSARLAMATLLVSAFIAVAASANFALLVPWANQTARARAGVAPEPDELFPSQLRREREAAARAGDGGRVRALDVYFYSRWAFATASIVFAVAALALTAGRARTLLSLACSMAVVIALYYVAWRIALWSALSGRLAAWAATWIPNTVVLLAAGIFAARRGPHRGSRARVGPRPFRSSTVQPRQNAGGRRRVRRLGLPVTRQHERRS
ncbi:MAG: LptF/LptG family permease [Acidimicrobiia bacterium]|nr:LptF/LptG family permease [Acidimicrobiia bacterium]